MLSSSGRLSLSQCRLSAMADLIVGGPGLVGSRYGRFRSV
jgi:hypothetical protein